MSGIIKKTIDSIDQEILRLGIQGENRATSFLIEASSWLNLVPEGVVSAIMQTPSGNITRVPIKILGSSIVWEITNVETYESGTGKIQFTFKDTNGIVLKSKIVKCFVYPSINGHPGQAPNFSDIPAETALKLETPREIALIGDVAGASMFDGSRDIQINTVVSTLTNLEMEELLK